MRARETKSTLKNKKRAYPDVLDKGKGKAEDAVMPVSPPLPRIKKPKRAETRPCPICDEPIPLRLMSLHAQLESERVEGIIKQIGSLEPILLPEDLDDSPSSSSAPRSRRSALKALRSISNNNNNNASNAFAFASTSSSTTMDQVAKTIQTFQRNRKNRYARYREMWREEEEDEYSARNGWMRRAQVEPEDVRCPVCLQMVRGDDDVVNAHVDACLAGGSWSREGRWARGLEGERVREYDLPDGAVGHVGDVRGLGFHTRNLNAQDVEDEVDIDGDDQYGEPQFTEGDILPVRDTSPEIDMDEYVEVELEGDDRGDTEVTQKTLRQLIVEAEAKKRDPFVEESTLALKLQGLNPEKMDMAIASARKGRDKEALVAALENKIDYLELTRNSSPSSSLCRICLDSYNEPTISTGCWHTCCRECWLRTLGSTKLCPICKRITGATELRRIYL